MGRLRPRHRRILRQTDAPNRTARACDLHRRFHGLTKADAFQHRMGAFSDAELADVLHRAVALKADVAPSMWNG